MFTPLALYRAESLEAVLHQQFTFYLNLYFKAVFGIEIKLHWFEGLFCVLAFGLAGQWALLS